MADAKLRKLERQAALTGIRKDIRVYYLALIRVGEDPLPLFRNLAERFGHIEDIDDYLEQVAQSEEKMDDFLEPLRANTEEFEMPAYFDYYLAKAVIQDVIDLTKSRLEREWSGKSHYAYPDYNVEQVLRVYSIYYQEEIYDLGPVGAWAQGVESEQLVENWQRGMVADVILDDGVTTTIWVENSYAIPDAPDAVPYGSTVRRFDHPKWLWSRARSLMRAIDETAPSFAKVALLPRLQKILDDWPYDE